MQGIMQLRDSDQATELLKDDEADTLRGAALRSNQVRAATADPNSVCKICIFPARTMRQIPYKALR